MNVTTEKNSIKYWAEDDQPREKMMNKGRNALSDAELLAILLSSGNRDESAVALSKRILKDSQNDLNLLARLTLADFKKYNGVGDAKAVTIAAALELGRRRKLSDKQELIKVVSSGTAYEEVKQYFEDLNHEEFWVILVNRASQIINISQISKGGVSGTYVDGKIIFKTAIDKLASGLILAHNHPSGNLQPSIEDKKLTKKLREFGDFIEIPILDHLIITDKGYFSFADEGILRV